MLKRKKSKAPVKTQLDKDLAAHFAIRKKVEYRGITAQGARSIEERFGAMLNISETDDWFEMDWFDDFGNRTTKKFIA